MRNRHVYIQLRQLRNFKYLHPTMRVMWEDRSPEWKDSEIGEGKTWGADWQTILTRLSDQGEMAAVSEQKGLWGYWGSPTIRSQPAGTKSGGGGQAKRKPRGVIFLVTDTLRKDHLNIYGYQRETVIHVAFCPPLPGIPEIETEDLEGADLEIRVAAAFAFVRAAFVE